MPLAPARGGQRSASNETPVFALMSLDDAGVLTIHQDVAPVLDAEPVPWLSEAEDRTAQAIGAVTKKIRYFQNNLPHIIERANRSRKCPCHSLSRSVRSCTTMGRVTHLSQASAPEIQRQQAAAKKQQLTHKRAPHECAECGGN